MVINMITLFRVYTYADGWCETTEICYSIHFMIALLEDSRSSSPFLPPPASVKGGMSYWVFGFMGLFIFQFLNWILSLKQAHFSNFIKTML